MLHSLCSYLPNLWYYTPVRENADNPVIYSDQEFDVSPPKNPLTSDSLEITPKNSSGSFTDWTQGMHIESFALMKKIAFLWKQKGTSDYLIYGKESRGSSFKFEMVPYEKSSFSFFRQMKVLWNIAFGSAVASQSAREATQRAYQKDRETFSSELSELAGSVEAIASTSDAFCRMDVTQKQRVFEGKKINVLYNYAPIAIGKGKLHFLLVTKEHRASFSEMTEEEYAESAELASKLIRHYNAQGFDTAYLFEKTGKRAGQTVGHRHLHLVFTAAKTEEIMGKLMVLKNMLFGSSPMAGSELKERVGTLKSELESILGHQSPSLI